MGVFGLEDDGDPGLEEDGEPGREEEEEEEDQVLAVGPLTPDPPLTAEL